MTETSRAARQKPRRRPLQARSWATSLAIQEAFVRVLLERGYESVTIRDVAAVAGVGVGTFYEYFPNKEALAAVCLRTRMKALVNEVAELALAAPCATLAELTDTMLDRMVARLIGKGSGNGGDGAPGWAALLHLERRISTPEAYLRLYRMATEMWAAALGRAVQPPGPAKGQPLEHTAYVVHTASYSLLTQRIMGGAGPADAAPLRRQLGVLVHAYLGAEGYGGLALAPPQTLPARDSGQL